MDGHTNSHHQYEPYVEAVFGRSSGGSSISERHELPPHQPNGYAYLDEPFRQPRLYIPRKPVAQAIHQPEVEHDNEADNKDNGGRRTRVKARKQIYWMTPAAALILFVIGLAAAIGHYVFLLKIHDTAVIDQTWTLRYSLAIAFMFKATLAASISIALAQHVWFTLQHRHRGTSVATIDAMFLAESSLVGLLSPSLWRSAFVSGLMAACIWLLPLTALVSPTALTVGTSSVNATDENCIVPTVNMNATPNFFEYTDARALYAAHYSGVEFQPSAISKRIVNSVLTNGRSIGWPSPCGLNCTYQIQFFGPSWQCLQTDNIDDPRATWKAQYTESFWYAERYSHNDTVNSSVRHALQYSPVYQAGLNKTTNQFWSGFASGLSKILDNPESEYGKSLYNALAVQVYYCQIANTSYTMQVDYTGGIQNNTLLKVEPFEIFSIAAQSWNGSGSYSLPGEEYAHSTGSDIAELVGMYTPMITMLSGGIRRDPRTTFVAGTSLGMVPSLIQDQPIKVKYSAETPYLPRENLGPLLQQLSYNVTISLMSEQSLFVTNITTTTCYKHHTVVVWKFHRMPLVVAYATGLGVTLICLIIGTYALLSNGVAHDNSFSSIIRTTRNEELIGLCDSHGHDVGSLPLAKDKQRRRLRMIDDDTDTDKIGLNAADGMTARTGFVLVN